MVDVSSAPLLAWCSRQATGNPAYVAAGASFLDALTRHCRVAGGFASVRSVVTMALEDHMHSFFLAETTKYLALLFNPTFYLVRN